MQIGVWHLVASPQGWRMQTDILPITHIYQNCCFDVTEYAITAYPPPSLMFISSGLLSPGKYWHENVEHRCVIEKWTTLDRAWWYFTTERWTLDSPKTQCGSKMNVHGNSYLVVCVESPENISRKMKGSIVYMNNLLIHLKGWHSEWQIFHVLVHSLWVPHVDGRSPGTIRELAVGQLERTLVLR